ncbi:MAG TPA: NAD(P)H-dependent glycerol-3-phosphate dehydrogenase, partial [Gammaproteobacteria bacterium]|nr:NAD(P)H-dependent glycerol-3-phosphate dehydrogenase [Gammaproteobacteria bacterium]
RRFGLALGAGVKKEQAEADIGQAIEGLYNVDLVHALSQKHQIDMPITRQVYRIVHESLDPQIAVRELLERTPKSE